MSSALPVTVKTALAEKLAESLVAPLPDSTPRQVFGSLELPGKATAVIGMRRAGKTTFLHQLRQVRLKSGLARECLPYVNFEDERLTEVGAEHLGFLLEEYGRQMPLAVEQGRVLWCFDEIQEVPGWERFVRRLLDAGNADVVVTGSSAALLSQEIATSLRGRAWEVALYPFSFHEALLHGKQAIPEDPAFLAGAARSRLERAFLDWLAVGGFPEAQGLPPATRERVLRDYVDVAMLRDVVERHQVSQVAGLRWMVRHLLSNAAGMFSVEKFHGALKSQGLAISKDTVHHLLSHLEDCFLIRTVWMESKSERQRMVNPRKAYPVDPGLIPVFDRSGRANIGHALESAVFIELERRRHQISYVRTKTGQEVDFLARGPGDTTELIQVCADASDAISAKRELRALLEAGQDHPKAHLRLLTLTRDSLPTEIPPGVLAQPAYEWMLNGAAEMPV